MGLLNANHTSFIWRPPWLSKRGECSPYFTTTSLLNPSFTDMVTSMDRSVWYFLENSGYSEGKALSLSTFLRRLPYCTRSEDLTISSYSTRAELSTTRPVG